MADKQGSIYYQKFEEIDFDRACSFLAKEGLTLLDKPENGKILGIDDEGEYYEISYEQAKQKALNEDWFNLAIWLDYKWRTFWTFSLHNNYLIQDFYLGCFLQEDRNRVSKIFTKFVLSEISSNPQSVLGMFIDKKGATYGYNFDPFFLTDSENIDYVTDLICTSKEKLKMIEIEPSFAVKELDNGYVCVSRYPEFLDYLLS